MAKHVPFLSLAWDSWLLAGEASAVIAMRMARFGDLSFDGLAEANRMVLEKYMAATGLTVEMMTGQLGPTPEAGARRAVRHYRKVVAGNRRRLGARKR